MQLSIIIPVLNDAPSLGACLERLAPLREAGHEIIVVDGGSDDDTRGVVRQWDDQLLVSRPGRARQMNRGAEVARGEILLFLHADTRLPAQATRLLRQGLGDGDRLWGRFDVRLSGRHPLFRVIERLMNWRSCLTGIATGDQAMFVRRESFRQLGGFADIPLMEDIELSRRLRRLSRPVCLRPPVITSSRRWEQQGILRTIGLMWGLRLAYFLGVSPSRLAAIYYPGRRQA